MSEPKVEPWMRALALGLAVVDWDAGKVVVEERDGYRVTEPTDQLIDGVAKLIASQMPKPEDQPIRRGDVVQAIRRHYVRNDAGYQTTVNPGEMFVVAKDEDRPGLKSPEIRIDRWDFPCPANCLAHIGRVRYYPDGTPVEG